MKRFLPAALLLAGLVALVLVTWQPSGAAVVTGANVQRYYKDGSSGYDYEHMIAGSNSGSIDPLGTDGSGSLKVNVSSALPAGTNTLGAVNLQPATSGGLSVYRNLDLGSTGQVVKSSAGQLYGWALANQAASSVRYLKIYDKATAATSSDTPLLTLPLPSASLANVAFPNGIAFASGISVRATTGIADNDTGAPSTNDVVVNLNYK